MKTGFLPIRFKQQIRVTEKKMIFWVFSNSMKINMLNNQPNKELFLLPRSKNFSTLKLKNVETYFYCSEFGE